MAILDFKEIPEAYHGKPHSKKDKVIAISSPGASNGSEVTPRISADLDAFEKFASEFFQHVCGCKIIQAIARGQDGGRDLLVEGELSPTVQGRLLISCKHKASSGNSVNTDKDEPNAKGRLDASGAKFFIGFYSTIASAGLRRHLEETRTNHKDFDFLIFNSSDIEWRLISVNEPRGWLLAARYFPKSMGNLFRRFVVPVNYYKAEDVKHEKARFLLNGPYGGTRAMPSNITAIDEVKRKMAEEANDALTSDLYCVFFCDALVDFIRLLPHAFAHLPGADPTNLELAEVMPNFAAARTDFGDGHQTTLRTVAAVWSFWDAGRAVKWLEDKITDPLDIEQRSASQVFTTACSVTIGQISRACDGTYRDILARLVAYCPVGITTVPFGVQVMRNGKRLQREKHLDTNFQKILLDLNGKELEELDRYGGRHSGERGWNELCTILGWEKVLNKLDAQVAAAMRQAPISLGDFSQPSQIGFNRTVYTQWLEKSLNLSVPRAFGDAPDTGQA
ncbi:MULTISPECIES: hypothetical protein [Achromobacter]|uniref:hypothetical protein n=1 Tax=Achromobacter TaxID=222 RepID=UPI0007BEE9E7|nr:MULTISPECIES: hypothetical protein [Achromobacter]QEQ23878.1 hypothetical protein F0U64_16585 [Achromobacter xylosoxidans]